MTSRALVFLVVAAASGGCGSNSASQLFNEGPAPGAGGSDAGTSHSDGSAGTDSGKLPGDAGKDAVASDTELPPPDSGCEPGQTLQQPCGLNGRGTLTYSCENGAWTAGECADPDVCVDGSNRQMECGANDAGMVDQSCIDGQWQDQGECTMPPVEEGRWACENGACVPKVGDPACGDGTCSASGGESPSACSKDCAAMVSESGQGKPCNDDIDCAFFAWPASGTGYWECRWDMGKSTCNAVQTANYCGTSGLDYCYFGSLGIETPASCPQDCANMILNQNVQQGCKSATDCIFLDWPVN